METTPVRVLMSRTSAPVLVHELSRRRLFTLVAAVGGTAVLASCASPGVTPVVTATGGTLEDELSIYTWGDYDAPDVLSEFTSELGPTLTLDSYGSNEEMISKLVAARGTGGYDIVVPTGVYVPQMVANGLLAELNKDLIPNLSAMDPAYLGRAWDPNNTHSICKAWGTTGFVYDTTVIARELTGWGDFLDAAQNEASGKTSVLDDPAEVAGLYYWANDIDWTTTVPAEMDACEQFIVENLAKHIAAFDSYPGSGAIPQGTHALIQAWNGDARQGILSSSDPDRWRWVLPTPASELWMDNWAITASAPHPEAAHAFINDVLAPENAIRELDYIGYHTGALDLQPAAESLGLERLDMVFFTPEQIATLHDGAINDATARNVDIWTRAKAAAGA
jgi:spermidine/putrescine transport system substrate-binding protein